MTMQGGKFVYRIIRVISNNFVCSKDDGPVWVFASSRAI